MQREYYSSKKKKILSKLKLLWMKKIKKLYLYVLLKGMYIILHFSKIQLDNYQLHFIFADSGYQRILAHFKNSMIQKKKSKRQSTHR